MNEEHHTYTAVSGKHFEAGCVPCRIVLGLYPTSYAATRARRRHVLGLRVVAFREVA